MTVAGRFKAPSASLTSVAVIASEADLAKAARLRRPPDFFELRLDALHPRVLAQDDGISALPAPCLVTARDPREGGLGNLGPAIRRDLLLKFLPRAAYVDVELRSATVMRPVFEAAKARRVKRIISVHALRHAPAFEEMAAWADAAHKLAPEVFKIAVRTDTTPELDRLIAFFEQAKERLRVSAMGIGKLGRRSRIELARRGSALTYVHLGTAQSAGQLSLRDWRRLIGSEVVPSSRSP